MFIVFGSASEFFFFDDAYSSSVAIINHSIFKIETQNVSTGLWGQLKVRETQDEWQMVDSHEISQDSCSLCSGYKLWIVVENVSKSCIFNFALI